MVAAASVDGVRQQLMMVSAVEDAQQQPIVAAATENVEQQAVVQAAANMEQQSMMALLDEMKIAVAAWEETWRVGSVRQLEVGDS